MGIPSIGVGIVRSLAVNGQPVKAIYFGFAGPQGDSHAQLTRPLSGHDGDYIKTSSLVRGSRVFNTRTWSALSSEEMREIEKELECTIPIGILLENMVVEGIPGFSVLKPTSRLVFPRREISEGIVQAVLAVWEENGPCETVGARLESFYLNRPGLKTDFVRAAQHRRGNVGIVYSPGRVEVGDMVTVYPPVP